MILIIDYNQISKLTLHINFTRLTSEIANTSRHFVLGSIVVKTRRTDCMVPFAFSNSYSVFQNHLVVTQLGSITLCKLFQFFKIGEPNENHFTIPNRKVLKN